jgi:hypothetical protein
VLRAPEATPANQLTTSCVAVLCGRQSVLVCLGRAITQRHRDRAGDRLDEGWTIEIKWMESETEQREVVPALQQPRRQPDRTPSTHTTSRGPIVAFGGKRAIHATAGSAVWLFIPKLFGRRLVVR